MESAVKQKQATEIRSDVHQQVTDIIIEQLENGTVPWQQSWRGEPASLSLPKNVSTGDHYKGINIVLLWSAAINKQFTTSEWATFDQWNKKNESVRRGENGSLILKYDTMEKLVDGEIKTIPYLKRFKVFNRCQLASYKPNETETYLPDLVEKLDPVEQLIANTDALIVHREGGACYMPSTDTVYMPFPEWFINTQTCTATEGYYSTILHELIHWSGKSTRLDRNSGKKFGDKRYANEELVAELGAAFLCAEFGIATVEKGDHAAYIAGWIKVLKENKYAITSIASQASIAANYLKSFPSPS